jgi:hypothetical protein
MRVAEAPNPFQRPEIMVERAVLRHQDDDVANVEDAAGGAVGGDRQRARNAQRNDARD